MRSIIFTMMALAISGLFFTSCGGNSEICGCADTMLSMEKELKEVDKDYDKRKTIRDKYKEKMTKCRELGKGKSDDEQKKMREELKKCSSFTELEKLRDEK